MINSIKSISNNHIFRVSELMVGAIFAGYLVSNLNPKFLNQFNKFHYQLFVVFLIFNQNFTNIPFYYIFFDALVFTISLQMFIYGVNSYYDKDSSKKTDKE